VASSGECLRGDGRCAERIVSNYSPVVLAAYLPQTLPLVVLGLRGAENAGLENAAPDCRGGKRGSSTVWKAEISVI